MEPRHSSNMEVFCVISGHPGMGPMQRMTHPGARMPGPMNPVSPMNPAVSMVVKQVNHFLNNIFSILFDTIRFGCFHYIVFSAPRLLQC